MLARLSLLVSTAVLLMGSQFGCVPSPNVDLFRFERPPSFNERIRLDRQPLDVEGRQDADDPIYDQHVIDVTVGAFRDGYAYVDGRWVEIELVSEVYPDFKDCPSDDPKECPTEMLMQPDCYWVAAADPFTGFDAVAMNWEAVVQFAPGTFVNELDETGRLREFGACRAAEPVTGVRAILDTEEWEADPRRVELPGFENHLNFNNAPDGRSQLDFGLDLPFTVVELSGVEPASDDGVCPPRASLGEPWRPFAGPETHTIATFETRNPPWEQGRVPRGDIFCRPLETTDDNDNVVARHYPACAYRCGTAPLRDGSYRLAIEVEQDGQSFDVERFLQPNLLVVSGRRETVRPMTFDGTLAWQTPVLGDAETGLRWHENWSPNVLVESVRVFERVDGREVPPELEDPGAGPELRLRLPRAAEPEHICHGTVTDDGVVFPIFNPQEEPDRVACELESEELLTTPGYLRATLDQAVAPITTPLSWEVVPAREPDREVFLEFTLRAETTGDHAVQMRGLVRMGKQELGTRRTELIPVRNVGSTVVTIDNLWIDGPQRNEFSARTLAAPVMVPLPVEMSRDDGAFTVALIPGHETDLDPLYVADPGYGFPHARVHATDHGGGSASAYGETLDFSDGYARLASRPAPFPVHASSGNHLFLGRPVYPDRPLPITLRPGETFNVAVTAEPQSWGERRGELWIELFPVADPGQRFRVTSVLRVEGAQADPASAPETLVFPRRGSHSGYALLMNVGSLPLVRQAFGVSGPQAQVFHVGSPHPPTRDLDPGESEDFLVRYDPAGAQLPAGSDHHEARLEVATSQGLVTWELRAYDPVEVTPPSLAFYNGVTELEVELSNRSLAVWFHRELPFSIGGPGADRFTATPTGPIFPNGLLAIGPGESETVIVEYEPICEPQTFPPPPPTTATLHLPTDWGTVLVELKGEVPSCTPTP